jgi:hypothetical protein
MFDVSVERRIQGLAADVGRRCVVQQPEPPEVIADLRYGRSVVTNAVLRLRH